LRNEEVRKEDTISIVHGGNKDMERGRGRQGIHGKGKA